MSSRYSGEGSEREGGDISATGYRQYFCLSEDRVEPSGGGTESGETAGDSVFFGLGEGTSDEKNLRDVSKRVSESGVVPLANDPVHGASGDLPETDQRDKSHQRSVFTFAHLRLQAGERVMVEKEIM